MLLVLLAHGHAACWPLQMHGQAQCAQRPRHSVVSAPRFAPTTGASQHRHAQTEGCCWCCVHCLCHWRTGTRLATGAACAACAAGAWARGLLLVLRALLVHHGAQMRWFGLFVVCHLKECKGDVQKQPNGVSNPGDMRGVREHLARRLLAATVSEHDQLPVAMRFILFHFIWQKVEDHAQAGEPGRAAVQQRPTAPQHHSAPESASLSSLLESHNVHSARGSLLGGVPRGARGLQSSMGRLKRSKQSKDFWTLSKSWLSANAFD